MRKILHAKVNVLIENNRLELQKKEKERQQQKKQQQKYSYSHYEQPSSQIQHLNVPSTPDSPYHYKQYATEDPDHIYHARFYQLERMNYQHQTMEELQQEQFYLLKIFQGINEKIEKQNINTIHQERPSSITVIDKLSSSSLADHKENVNKSRYRLQKQKKPSTLDISRTSNLSKITSNSPEQSPTHDSLSQLQAEYAHLESELSRFTRWTDTDNMEISLLEMENQTAQIRKQLSDRKKEISELKLDIECNSKNLVKENLSQEQIRCYCDQLSSLQAEIYKKKTKNKDKSSYLKTLQAQYSSIPEKQIQDSTSNLNDTLLKVPQQASLNFSSISTFKTANTNKSTKKSEKKLKLKHLTTLEMQSQLTPEQQMEYLTKKKQALSKSIEFDNKKWKQIYTQKMKKLVCGCSNIKDMHALTTKIQAEKETKQEEIWLLKQRTAMTEL